MGNNIKKVVNKISALRYELVEYIEQMPDNPETKPVDGKPNMYHISQSVFRKHDNWSAQYHILDCQKEQLITLIQTTRVDKLEDKLREVVKNGRMPNYGKNKGLQLHPIAIEHIRKLLED